MHGIGFERRRRFHGDEAKQLENMVLHHIAQRASGIVITGATFKADSFSDRDLHVVDMRRIPERLIECIGKAQSHQVLNSFLAKIMVDTENLVFAENAADRVVKCVG
ncbi:hypothetical protein FQZ97_1167320 [compost metagenome]